MRPSFPIIATEVSRKRDWSRPFRGGIDYINNPSGLYLGAWTSNIHWIEDEGGDGNIEIDIYGGKRGNLFENTDYDVGVLTYNYPSNDLGRIAGSANANTIELYGQLSHGPAYAKYSYSLSNLFGFVDSKGSGYLDVGANVSLTQGIMLTLHAGHQTVSNNSTFSYSDWKIGLGKDFDLATITISYIDTNTNTKAYVGPAPDMKQLGKGAIVVSASKMF